MLKLAIEYRNELARAIIRTSLFEKNQYFHCLGYTDYAIDIRESDYDGLQMVSVVPQDCVLGYFACGFDRIVRKAYRIEAINFSYKNNTLFARDMFTFLDGLFTTYGMNKVEWSVVVGNPIEAQYDRIAKRYGGRIIGVEHQTCALRDGTLCDMKYYELMRSDYMQRRRMPREI